MVTSTHLYYHPKGDHVRLVQAAVMVNYLRTRVEKFSNILGENSKIATVIGADFNSCPCIAAYHYLTTGSVERTHEDWMVYKKKDIPRCPCYYKHGNHGSKDENHSKEEGGEAFVDKEESLLPHMLHQSDMLSGDLVEDDFKGLDLKHDFHFSNVTGTEECTNYTKDFKAVLDYIFIDSDHLTVERTVPLPPVNELMEFVALPSVYFPSDHLALVADLKWK